jgi:RecB family endonuclease NucS
VESLILNETEIFNRKLRIFTSPEGFYGRQYAIPGLGRIDLLAEDRATGDLVVIELKRDESHDQVVGQICLYLSWVKENLAREGQRVIGIICALKTSERLRLAAKNVKELELFEYDVTFKKA